MKALIVNYREMHANEPSLANSSKRSLQEKMKTGSEQERKRSFDRRRLRFQAEEMRVFLR